MIQIIPAIIAHSSDELEQKLNLVESHVDRVHLDIMDGIFVENNTISGVEELNQIDTKLLFDVHLMVKKPDIILDKWLTTRADRILVHIEANFEVEPFINKVKASGKKVGLVINPDTGIEKLNGFVHLVDAVQFMTVHPGNYGGEFVEGVVDNIVSFHNKYPNVKIIVDGAMHKDTAKMVIAAGASDIVFGSHIFNEEKKEVGEIIKELKSNL